MCKCTDFTSYKSNSFTSQHYNRIRKLVHKFSPYSPESRYDSHLYEILCRMSLSIINAYRFLRHTVTTKGKISLCKHTGIKVLDKPCLLCRFVCKTLLSPPFFDNTYEIISYRKLTSLDIYHLTIFLYLVNITLVYLLKRLFTFLLFYMWHIWIWDVG